MDNKNSLASLKLQPQNKLLTAKKNMAQSGYKKPWRKPKPTAELRTERLVIKLTTSEMKKFEEKSWITAKWTYLRHFLFNQTDLFK